MARQTREQRMFERGIAALSFLTCYHMTTAEGVGATAYRAAVMACETAGDTPPVTSNARRDQANGTADVNAMSQSLSAAAT